MKRRRVMVIEPDWRIRRLIQVNLEAFGFEVQGAVNGRHSLHLLSRDQPDLIVVDADMPDMEVEHLLDRLQAQSGKQVPIIVLSSEPPSRRPQQNDHRLSYLVKPFSALALLRQVWQALGDVEQGTG
jgi:DNA-binding response OmpR family regulator